MKRRPHRPMALAFAFLAVSGPLGTTRSMARPPEAPTIEEVVAAVRAEEAKYRDIEYWLRISTRKADPKEPEGPGEPESQEKRRVVLQGDRIYYRGDATTRAFGAERRVEVASAFDGERTVTVVGGNSANIHLGRFEHHDVYPAHAVPLIHYRLNFPLSVYLSGGDAIHSHPKYGRFAREGGSTAEFPKVEARVEGEERVDGLLCVKIRVDRWYRSKEVPALQYLWLATGRNYLCIKEELSWPKSMFGDLPMHEMHVDELREVAPGLWFPLKITVVDYDRDALRGNKKVVGERTETVVQKVVIGPRPDPALFRGVEIPDGLATFTLKDGKLVGSALPEPIADEAEERAKLEQVVARVREEEQRYRDLEVKARVLYTHVGSDRFMGGIITEQTHSARSVVRGASEYYAEHTESDSADGGRTEEDDVQAFDGRWTRQVHRMVQNGQAEQRWATLRKGGLVKAEGRHDGVAVLRPHTFLVRDDWLYGPLADLMVSPWHDKINKYRLRFRYCGEEEFEGHPCVKVRGEVTTGQKQAPSSFLALWLAADRNFIPIKLEHYGGNGGLQARPGGISRSEDLREIAPGVWYPFRSTLLSFGGHSAAIEGRVELNWRRVYEVESIKRPAEADAALFHDVVVPAGMPVQVSDEAGQFLGRLHQAAEGVFEITDADYLALVSGARAKTGKK